MVRRLKFSLRSNTFLKEKEKGKKEKESFFPRQELAFLSMFLLFIFIPKPIKEK